MISPSGMIYAFGIFGTDIIPFILNKNREASPSTGEENSANIAGNAVNLSDPTISSS